MLSLLEMVLGDGSDLRHAVPHLLHVVHYSAMRGWPTLPRLLGEVEESWSSPVQQLEGEKPVEAWGFTDCEQDVGQELVHHPLERGGCAVDAEQEDRILVKTLPLV